jgi:NADH-quinone oxidoreductase subunit G
MTNTSEAPPVEGVAVTINGKPVVAEKGELVIEAAEKAGVYIPRFCYHPRMESVGMCRMCIVEIDGGRGPALQPACMIECTPDMKVDTQSPVTKKAQDGVLEFLLLNHPLDCPVCDKGGECPLQDQTLAYGPGESRFIEEKRHNEKPIPISDLVLLDRERCILCDRCTRFAKDVAGDPLIHFINRGHESEVNTFPDHPFASYFSGNTVQICPVGALTATPYRFKARPWDLDQTESTCTSCSVGCRVAVQASRNEVLRYLGVDIDPVNWGWLCDKGRFGFEAVNAENRLRDPLVKGASGEFAVTRWSDALVRASDAIANALGSSGADSIAVIGGARLTNEDAYAWTKLAKGFIGTDNVDCQVGDGLPASAVLGLPKATIDELCAPGGTVVLMGPDVKEELPVLFLRLRHAVLNDGVKIVEVSPGPTSMSEYAAVAIHPRPAEAHQAVRSIVDGQVVGKDGGGIDPSVVDAAHALVTGDAPVTVLLGRQSLSEQPDSVVEAASVLLDELPGVRFLSGLRRGNVHGALDMGLAPGLLPGRTTLENAGDWYRRVWPQVPTAPGLDTAGVLEAAAAGRIKVLVLLGADPMADFPDRAAAEAGLAGIETIIAVDQFLNESAQQAHIVLPAAGFAECAGTTTNLEGRVSILNQKITPPGTARTDWIIAAELARLLGSDLQLESLEDIWDEIEELAPSHRGLTLDLLGSLAATDGIVVPLPESPVDLPLAADDEEGDAEGDEAAEAAESETETESAPPPADPRPAFIELTTNPMFEAPALDAYSFRLVTARKLYDLGTLVSQSPHLAELAPGTALHINPYDFDRLGVAEGETLPVQSPRGQIDMAIRTDMDLPRGTAFMYFNQPGPSAASFIDATLPVTEVRVETRGAS